MALLMDIPKKEKNKNFPYFYIITFFSTLYDAMKQRIGRL
jgi:hypothetical protein